MDTKQAREKWLEVLRDPQSRKRKGQLASVRRDSTKRCCLGHACHALGMKLHEELPFAPWRKWGQETELPDHLARVLDITNEGYFCGEITINNNQKVESLVQLNDDTDLTPAQIADIIEREFKCDNLMPYTEGEEP